MSFDLSGLIDEAKAVTKAKGRSKSRTKKKKKGKSSTKPADLDVLLWATAFPPYVWVS